MSKIIKGYVELSTGWFKSTWVEVEVIAEATKFYGEDDDKSYKSYLVKDKNGRLFTDTVVYFPLGWEVH